MNAHPTSEKLVAARIDMEEVLDQLHPGYAATNTTLVNAIEALIREVLIDAGVMVDRRDDI